MKGDSVKSKTGLELKAQYQARTQASAVTPVMTRREQLDGYKGVVAKRQRDFVEIGTALGLIRKEGLFEEDGYKSFEEFVEREFDMTRSYAYRLVDAARVISILSPMATLDEPGSKIKNEAQARQLVPLGKDRAAMLAVLDAAEKRGERLTAAALADARDELYPGKKIIDGDIVRPKPAVVAGMRKAIERAAEPKPRCESCGDVLDDGIAKAAQYRCLKCDPDRIHAGSDYGKPCEPCVAAELETAALVGENETSAAVTADTTEDTSLVLGEPAPDDLAASGAGTQTATGGADTPPVDGVEFAADEDAPAGSGDAASSPDPVTPEGRIEEEVPCFDCSAPLDPRDAADGYYKCLDCDPERLFRVDPAFPAAMGCPLCSYTVEVSSVDPDASVSEMNHHLGRTHDLSGQAANEAWVGVRTIPPAAGTALPGDDASFPLASDPQQPGQDSPTGPAYLGDPEAPAIATGRSETDHHPVEGGEAPANSGAVGPDGVLGDGGGTSDLPSSSSDPVDEPAEPVMPRDRLMAAFEKLADYIALIDVDTVGPQMFGEDMEQLFEHTELFEEFVRRLGKARFAEMLTP